METLTQYNEVQRSVYIVRHAFAGFSQTAQVLLAGSPLDWLESEQLDQIIIETMIEALRTNLTVAADEVADLVLYLTTVLRKRLNMEPAMEERAPSTTMGASGKRYGNLLDGSVTKTGRKSVVHCTGILATALRLLIESTLKTGEFFRKDAPYLASIM